MTAMTPGDAARILAVAAAFDRRTVGELDAQAWADALDDLDPRDCAEAVRAHYRDSDRWVMPSHVRDLVTAKYRDQARRDRDAATLREIEAAGDTAAREQARIDAAKAEARRAFREAIERIQPHDDTEQAS